MFIKVLLTIIFLAVMIGVGLYTRKQASSVEGFVLGGRAVGPWLTAFAFGTSYFSAVVFVGYAGQFGWRYGLSSAWIGIGNAIIGSLLAWIILGKRTKQMTQHIESRTMPDFFGTRFQEQPASLPLSSSSPIPQESIAVSPNSSRWVSTYPMNTALSSCPSSPPSTSFLAAIRQQL